MLIKKRDIRGKVFQLTKTLPQKLPPKTAYWFGRLLKRLGVEYQMLERNREALAVKYSNKDTHGEPIMITENVCRKCGQVVKVIPANETGKAVVAEPGNSEPGEVECPQCKGKEFGPKTRYDISDMDSLNEEYEELLDQEIEIKFNPIPLTDEFFSFNRVDKNGEKIVEKIAFLPDDMMFLAEFVTIPEGEGKEYGYQGE